LGGGGSTASRAEASNASREPRGTRERGDDRTFEDPDRGGEEAEPWAARPPEGGKRPGSAVRGAPGALATLSRGVEDAEVRVYVREGIASANKANNLGKVKDLCDLQG